MIPVPVDYRCRCRYAGGMDSRCRGDEARTRDAVPVWKALSVYRYRYTGTGTSTGSGL